MLRNYFAKSLGQPEPFDYRVLVVGRMDKPAHIYIEYKEKHSSEWIPFDPTYPKNEYGKELFHAGFKKIYYE